jgi:hypothetical protein
MTEASTPSWTVERLFGELRELSPLRVISICGPSVFETICSVGAFGVAQGSLNAITPAYHWHLEIDGCARARTRDQVHERSGRQVLFLELFAPASEEPFLSIYLHREKGAEFEAARLERFRALHAALADGVALTS